jgi:hypothetical protein
MAMAIRVAFGMLIPLSDKQRSGAPEHFRQGEYFLSRIPPASWSAELLCISSEFGRRPARPQEIAAATRSTRSLMETLLSII